MIMMMKQQMDNAHMGDATKEMIASVVLGVEKKVTTSHRGRIT